MERNTFSENLICKHLLHSSELVYERGEKANKLFSWHIKDEEFERSVLETTLDTQMVISDLQKIN